MTDKSIEYNTGYICFYSLYFTLRRNIRLFHINRVDHDHTLLLVTSNLGLHCLQIPLMGKDINGLLMFLNL